MPLRYTLNAVLAPCEWCLQIHKVHHLRQSQRDHGKVNTLSANGQQTHHPGQQRGTQHREQNTQLGGQTPDLGRERCGIVTFTVDGRSADEVKSSLAARGINVSTTTVNGTRVDMEQRGLTAMTRASVHYYNSEDEVARAVAAVEALRR